MKKFKVTVFKGVRLNNLDKTNSLQEEMLVVSPYRAKSLFKCSLENETENYHPFYLEELDEVNFRMAVRTREGYLNHLKVKEHPIDSRYNYPEWIGRSVLVTDSNEIKECLENIVSRLNCIQASLEDIFFRLQVIIPSYDVEIPSSNHLQHIYPATNYPISDFPVYKQRFSIVTRDFLLVKGDVVGCVLEICSRYGNELGEKGRLNFLIHCFIPEYVADHSIVTGELFPPHIVMESIDTDVALKYIEDTLGGIRASSEYELQLKLSVFTNSFISGSFLSKKMYSDLEYQIEAEYKIL